MPFVFLVLGLLFLIVAIKGTQGTLFALLKQEFVGSNSFVPWASAIIILGLIGYAKPVKPIADGLIGLILLVILLGNKGSVFSQFNAAIRNPTAPAPASSTGSTSANAAAPAIDAGTWDNPVSTGIGAGTGAGTSPLYNVFNAAGQWIGMSTTSTGTPGVTLVPTQ